MARFLLLTCASYLLTLSAQATDYHVCSTGNDSNDGLSHATAWKSYEKARSSFSSLNGGDSILFCNGAEFMISAGTEWDNRNSTKDNPVLISNYAPPAGNNLENPIIFASSGGNGFALSNGGNAEHKEGYILSNLIVRGNKISGNGIFIYNDTDFISLVDIEVYDFHIGIHAGGSNEPNPGSDGKNSDLTIRGGYIHDNDTQGFLGSGDNLLIEDSVFVNNGWERAILNHNIYLGGSGKNETIRNNWLYQSAMFDGKCSGVSLVAHGVHTNLRIENNVIREDVGVVNQGCWGIAIDNGYGSTAAEQFQGLVIRGNTVVNVGNMAIGCSVCQDGIIEDNTVVHQNPSFGNTAISVPNRDESDKTAFEQSNNMIVRNNVVLHDSPTSAVGINLGDGDGSSYTSVNNQVYYSPDSGMVAGCEYYNSADVINVSAGICQNIIPRDTLDQALSRAEIPAHLGRISSSGDYAASSEYAATIGFYHLVMLLTLAISRNASKRRGKLRFLILPSYLSRN